MSNDRLPNGELQQARNEAERLMGAVGLTLHLARKMANLSIRQLSEISGVRPDVIQRTERGTWIPTAEQLVTLQDTLRTELVDS